ncbi:MAG: radical SAM protein [Deltaproteobacteria bacterium]|nr:radical SAM protein [Deltaproteobacteria bacterium]
MCPVGSAQGVRSKSASSDLFSLETGSCKKKWKGRLPIALVFPHNYHLGMSNLGFQLLYTLLNANPDIVCERVFLPSDDSAPLSIESRRLLRDFPILLFSVSFEQDFLSIIGIMQRSGIAALTRERRQAGKVAAGTPLVVGGGVATFINPEPLAPYMDFFVLGEAEPVMGQLQSYLFKFVQGGDCRDLLRQAALNLPGCYVPTLYEPVYNDDGTLQEVRAADGLPPRIRKNIAADMPVAGHSTVLTPATEFANIHLVELGRGCSRGCRFCAAGYVYRPPRLWQPEAIIAAIKARPAASRRVGLLGMEMAHSDNLQEIAAFLLQQTCSLSFSSLRADALNETLLELLAGSGLKTAAIAPDGGSERLRRVINKGISRDDCLTAAEALVKIGVSNLKLYFMIGLPTETEEDLLELVELVRLIQNRIMGLGRRRGHLSQITLSINCFVPKAWTPFQFHGSFLLRELQDKVKFLRRQFKGFNNMKLSFDQPQHAFFQAMLARGDRRVGELLSILARGDKNWRQLCKGQGVKPEFYAARRRGRDEVFPWEIVDHGLDRRFLWAEYQLALRAKSSRGCEIAAGTGCRRCGVCV